MILEVDATTQEVKNKAFSVICSDATEQEKFEAAMCFLIAWTV